MKKNLLFIFLLSVILTAAFEVYFRGSGRSDFVAYWSASHLLVTGGSPYNQSEMAELQKSINPADNRQQAELISAWNPPWMVLALVPLGFLPYSIAVAAWTFVNIFLIGLILILAWQLSKGPENSRGILAVVVAGYFFGITISYLAIGQVTVLVLLGLILSVWWLNQKKDLTAGAILLLTTIKPHISYFFLLLLLIWVIKYRRWKVVEGFLIALAASLTLITIIQPAWVRDYINLIPVIPLSTNFTSTVGSFIANRFHTRIFQFSAILLILLIKPLLKTSETNGLFTAMNFALLVSLPLSPYGFSFDQIVLLPSIVQIIAWLAAGKLSTRTVAIVIGALVLFYAFVMYLLSINILEYYWFFMIPFILLFIYFITWKMSRGLSESTI